MQRQVRVALVMAALTLVGIVSPAHAQYLFISSPSASPNPYTYGQGVDVSFGVSFDPDYAWSVAVAVDVEIQGSDGFYSHTQEGVGPGQSFTSLSYHDGNAGFHTGGVSYTIYVFVIYYDMEWGWHWWNGPSYASPWANYQSPPTPSGENTDSAGWYTVHTTIHQWNQTLYHGSFGGRTVWEVAGGGNDTCWWPGSGLPKSESVAGSSWPVNGSNTYGPDLVGWLHEWVLLYRSWGRAPCDTTLIQEMMIDCPGCSSNPFHYVTNVLNAGFTDWTVWSERAGQYAERVWP
jgi:hypothetical protein